MRNIILIVLITFFASCTETNDDIAQKNVKEYILEKANDPDSYKSVSFGILADVVVTEADYMRNERYTTAMYNMSIGDSTAENLSMMEGAINRVNSEAGRYFIYHTYRLKNGFGGVMTYNAEFRLDDKLKVISGKELR